MNVLTSMLCDLGHDLRHAVRAIGARGSSRWFSLLVIATMAIGIGTTVGVFAFLSYFARPTIDAPGEERLVWLHRVTEEGSAPGTTLDDWRDLEVGSVELFDRAAGWRLFGASLEGPSRTRFAWGHAVSADYFELFGARPELGRLIGGSDDQPGAAPVVVLSHLTWRAQFDADPKIVGTTVLLNGKLPFTVIGVAHDGFQGEGIWTGIYLPMATAGTLVAATREVASMGRLRPGVSREKAEARLAELARGFDDLRPQESGKRQLRLVPTTEFNVPSGDPLYAAAKVLMVAVGLLLALACANVANLLLARGAARRRELAVHAALGAGRLRIARRLGFESLLLSFAGGALGLLLARGLTRLIERYLRFEIPVSMGDWAAGTTLTLDEGEIALFVVAITVASGLLFGLAPVLQIVRTDLVQALRSGVATGRSGWRARHALLAVQIALAVALLSGASLLARTLLAARSVELGFDQRDLALATLYVPRERTAAGGGERLQDELVRQVRALPGVEGAGLVATVPFSPVPATAKVVLSDRRTEINLSVVGDGYFETLGLDLLEGREFGSKSGVESVPLDSAETPRVLVVNRATAERFWPGRSPLGERVVLHEQGFEAAGEEHEIVGVVADSRYEPSARTIAPLAYLPISQHPRARATILIRARTSIAEPFHELLRTRYPDLALIGLAPFEEQMRRGLANQTMNAELSLGLAVVGLLFAVVGIFSVMSYTVAQRAKEIGIRLSVGAERADIRRWALATAARPLAWGLAIGVPAALGLGVLLESLLIGVTGRDPVTFAVVPIVLAAAALLAAWIPARRAARVDPAIVLRDS